MKYLRLFIPILFIALVSSCSNNASLGEKVKEPFSGSKYESNNRFFRGTGKGTSIKDNIARSKADIDAKNQLASQVNTTIKNVTDQYLAQTENANAADVADKFASLTRQVTNTNISDLRKIGEEKYRNGDEYTVYIAYEIKKNAMFRFLKKQARTDAKIDKATLDTIDEILDKQIADSEE
ncbi:MAG: hypothetical protein ABR574_11520 [Cryomorphaceae bacterium]|nr:hypothetical protein [Flavobacteriales bacterium]